MKCNGRPFSTVADNGVPVSSPQAQRVGDVEGYRGCWCAIPNTSTDPGWWPKPSSMTCRTGFGFVVTQARQFAERHPDMGRAGQKRTAPDAGNRHDDALAQHAEHHVRGGEPIARRILNSRRRPLTEHASTARMPHDCRPRLIDRGNSGSTESAGLSQLVASSLSSVRDGRPGLLSHPSSQRSPASAP